MFSKAVCPAGIATVIRTPVRGCGAVEVAPVLQQNAEVERAESVAALVRAAVRRLCAREIVLVLEQHA